MCEINFKSPRNKRHLAEVAHASTSKHVRSAKVNPPSKDELEKFYEKISESKMKPAILKITLPYAEGFIPTLSNSDFPIPISELYNPEMLHVDYLDLLSECEKVFGSLKVTTRSYVNNPVIPALVAI